MSKISLTVFKLREMQLPDCYFHLITNFLVERTFCVRIVTMTLLRDVGL